MSGDDKGPRNLAELFASWGPERMINPHEPRAFTKLASRYADLLQLIHRLEARVSHVRLRVDPTDTRNIFERDAARSAIAASEGYPGIAHDYETMRAAVRDAFEHGVCVKARFTTRGDKWREKHAEAIRAATDGTANTK